MGIVSIILAACIFVTILKWKELLPILKSIKTPLNVEPGCQPGIGGWLVLSLLGLIINPFRIFLTVYKDLWPVFSEGRWDILTNPTSDAFHPLWAPLLISEVVSNIVNLVLGLVTLWYFLKKSRFAPKLVISWWSFCLFITLADFILSNLIPAVAAESDRESTKELASCVIGAVIWIPYFLLSKRVKATFVK